MEIKLMLVCAGLVLCIPGRAAAPAWNVDVGRDGQRIWEFDVANDGSVLATVGPGLQATDPRPDRIVYLDGHAGRVLWHRRTRTRSVARPMLSATGDMAGYMEPAPASDDYRILGTLYLLDRRGRLLLTRFTRDDVALSPRGDRIAVHAFPSDGGGNWGMKMLDRRGRTLWQRPDMVEIVRFTADGAYLLTDGRDESRVWSVDGKPVWRVAGHSPAASDSGQTLAAMAGGLRIVRRGHGGTIEHRLPAGGQPRARWADGFFPAVARDGSLVVAAKVERSSDYVLRAFSRNGESRWDAPLPPLVTDNPTMHIIAIRPHGRDGFVVVFSGGGALDCYTVNPQGQMRRHVHIITWNRRDIPWQLSPDGRKLALSIGRDMRLYTLTP